MKQSTRTRARGTKITTDSGKFFLVELNKYLYMIFGLGLANKDFGAPKNENCSFLALYIPLKE